MGALIITNILLFAKKLDNKNIFLEINGKWVIIKGFKKILFNI